MLKELDTRDWKEAFAYIGETSPYDNYPTTHPPVAVLTNNAVSTEPVTREDVVEIIAVEEGQNDGPHWIGVFRLRDGRYASLDAGCDYTGWDCQANGDGFVAATLNEIINFGLTDSARQRLGYPRVNAGEGL